MNQPGTTPPADRYGQPGHGRRLGLTAVLVVVAAAFGAWLLWAALAASTPDVRSALLGFRVLDERRVQVRVEVDADREVAVRCLVEAENRFRDTVGVAELVAPPGRSNRREITTVVTTRERAVTATVVGCRPRDQD